MKGIFFWCLLPVSLLVACSNSSESVSVKPTETGKDVGKDEMQTSTQTTQAEDMLVNGKDTLVPVDAYNKAIYWDLKYATTDNFMHRVLYDTLKKVYVQKEVALRLAKCQQYLTGRNADYHLLVYDGVRPLSVQWEMWNALDSIPALERGKFVSNPRKGSVHNYGAALDLTICSSKRIPLDMGAPYDDIRKIAYPSLESEFLARGALTEQQVNNRKLLRRAMKSQGFLNIPTEWWHFNAYPRVLVKGKFELVEHELY